MGKIGVFYASELGNTELAAKTIGKELGSDVADVFDISALISTKKFLAYDYLILGISTWGQGDLHGEWSDFLERLEKRDLSGKTAALFGMGDQVAYSDLFADGMAEVYDFFAQKGAKLVGEWPDEGYNYDASKALRGGKFVGLVLDEENQPDLTNTRIRQWLEQIKPEMPMA